MGAANLTEGLPGVHYSMDQIALQSFSGLNSLTDACRII